MVLYPTFLNTLNFNIRCYHLLDAFFAFLKFIYHLSHLMCLITRNHKYLIRMGYNDIMRADPDLTIANNLIHTFDLHPIFSYTHPTPDGKK